MHPDKIPEDSLIFAMDGIVQESMVMNDLTELEAVFLALLANIEGLTINLISTWANQNKADNFYISSTAIGGLADTITWARSKSHSLGIISKFQ